MKFLFGIYALLLAVFLPAFLHADSGGDGASKPLKQFSIGLIGAYHLETTYTDPVGNTYSDPGDIDQRKYFGLSLRFFFLKNIGIGFSALLLDGTDTMYEFGTLVLGDLDLLFRFRIGRRLVFNAAAGLSRLYLYIRDKASQETSLQHGDICFNLKAGLEFFFCRYFSMRLFWKMQEYSDHHGFTTRMRSLVAGASFWL